MRRPIALAMRAALTAALPVGLALSASVAVGVSEPGWTLAAGSGQNEVFAAIAATSASNAWVVGQTPRERTLIEHWNGSSWRTQASPNPRTFDYLQAVSALSATNAWAVGYSQSTQSCTSCSRTLIEHWNGKSWSLVKSVDVSTSMSDILWGVKAISANDVWAAGAATNSRSERPIVEHWNGHSWKLVPGVPNDASPVAVTATSATDVWVAGSATLLHWNGIRWRSFDVPDNDALLAITASSPTDAWAVGQDWQKGNLQVALHWDGSSWKALNPPRTTGQGFNGVAAPSPSAVWVVGNYGKWPGRGMIERWNGTSWTRQSLPSGLSAPVALSGIAATSANNAWAIGGSGTRTLILRWNGHSWKTA